MRLDRLFTGTQVTLQGGRSLHIERARLRMVLMSGFFALVYLLLAARAFDLSVFEGAREMAGERLPLTPIEQTQLDEAESQPLRGRILDRNGLVLASSLPMAALSANPALILEPLEVAAGLAKIFPELEAGPLAEKLAAKNKRFLWVARNITPAQQEAVLRLGQPGLVFHEASRRVYPQGALGGPLVGYSDLDGLGLAGAERSFQGLAAGDDVHLAMDIRLQHILHREVARSIHDFSAKAGAGLILDIKTGEVLAGVSLPDFNPHEAGKADKEATFNRLTLGVYELGSLFKIFSTAAFLDKTPDGMNASFDATKPLKSGRHTISDYHAQNRVMTTPEVFMHSSNIGSALMGQAVGTEGLRTFYDDIGLLSPLDIGLKEIGKPLVPKEWREINTLTAAYGHGLSTTPLQAAAAVASIVNGGTLVKPRLLMDSAPQSGPRVITQETSDQMRALMRLVVTEGTAQKADVKGYELGGKTGTAEKVVGGRYEKGLLLSSFAGVFPMSDPRYLVFVMVDEPKGNKESFGYATAGWVAAPAVARVVEGMSGVLGLPPVAIPQAISQGLHKDVSYTQGGTP